MAWVPFEIRWIRSKAFPMWKRAADMARGRRGVHLNDDPAGDKLSQLGCCFLFCHADGSDIQSLATVAAQAIL